MKLRKATRKRIYEAAAKHESIQIAWPQSAPEPVPGHKYSVRGFDRETRLVVVKCKRKPKDERWEATVRLDNDPVRMLFGLRGTRNDEGDYLPEPEPVPSPYQDRLSLEGAMNTALLGAKRRQKAKVLANEQKAADDRKKGKPGTLARAAMERQQNSLRRAA